MSGRYLVMPRGINVGTRSAMSPSIRRGIS